MEVKRQLDVLDKQLATTRYIAGSRCTVADVAIWPWWGAIALGRLYNAGEFLGVGEYTHLIRWANELERDHETFRKGRMVCRGQPDRDNPIYRNLPALPNRHSRTDWDTAL